MFFRIVAVLSLLISFPAFAQIDPGWTVSFLVSAASNGTKISWNSAKSAKNLPIQYSLLLYTSPTGGTPALKLNGLSAPAATVSAKEIRALAPGVASGSPAKLYGTVTADDGVSSVTTMTRETLVVQVP